jgi:hypothetical protein
MSGRGVARTDCKTAKGRWNPAGRRAHSFRGGRRQSFCRTERQKTIGRINSAPKHSLAGALPKGSEAQKQPHAAGPNQVVIRESCLCNFRLLTFPFLRRGFDGPHPLDDLVRAPRSPVPVVPVVSVEVHDHIDKSRKAVITFASSLLDARPMAAADPQRNRIAPSQALHRCWSSCCLKLSQASTTS